MTTTTITVIITKTNTMTTTVQQPLTTTAIINITVLLLLLRYLSESAIIGIHRRTEDPLLAKSPQQRSQVPEVLHLRLDVAHQVRNNEARVERVGCDTRTACFGAMGELIGE